MAINAFNKTRLDVVLISSVPQTDQPEKVNDMNTSSDVAVAPSKVAPPLFASPWLALFSAFKNGWRRMPAKPVSKNAP